MQQRHVTKYKMQTKYKSEVYKKKSNIRHTYLINLYAFKSQIESAPDLPFLLFIECYSEHFADDIISTW